MAYLGKVPTYGNLVKQTLVPNGVQTNFTLNYYVSTPASLIVSVGGVLQSPENSYTITGGGNILVFDEAPASGLDIFVVFLGVQNLINVPVDCSVTTEKIANSAVTTSKIAASGVTAATYGNASLIPSFTVDCSGRITSASNVCIPTPDVGGGGQIICGVSCINLTSSNLRSIGVCFTDLPVTGVVTLPDATTLCRGAPSYVIKNLNCATTVVVRDFCCCVLEAILPCNSQIISLYQNSTAQGQWTIGRFTQPTAILSLTCSSFQAPGTCFNSFVDPTGALHGLAYSVATCFACAFTVKPTSTGYSATGTAFSLCSCNVTTQRSCCSYVLVYNSACHAGSGAVCCNCSVLQAINCDSTCISACAVNFRACCLTPTPGSWWSSAAFGDIVCGSKWAYYNQTVMNDGSACTVDTHLLYYIDTKTTTAPTICLCACRFDIIPFSSTERKCITNYIFFKCDPACDSNPGKILSIGHNGGITASCSAATLICLCDNNQVCLATRSCCGSANACAYAALVGWTVSALGDLDEIERTLILENEKYNDGGFRTYQPLRACIDSSGKTAFCCVDGIGNFPGSGLDGSTFSKFGQMGCCLWMSQNQNSTSYCIYRGWYKLCCSNPLTFGLIHCEVFSGANDHVDLSSACHTCTLAGGSNCNLCYDFQNSCCCISLGCRALGQVLCKNRFLWLCNSNTCVSIWGTKDHQAACFKLINYAVTLSGTCLCECKCLIVSNVCSCLTVTGYCFNPGDSSVKKGDANNLCVLNAGGASYRYCLACACGAVISPEYCIRCCACITCIGYTCTGSCWYNVNGRVLYTGSYNSTASLNTPRFVYDTSTYPSTWTCLGPLDSALCRPLSQSFIPETCSYMAYLGCCAATGATEIAFTIGSIDPATCTTSITTQNFENTSRSIYALNPNTCSVVYALQSTNEPVYLQTLQRVKLL